MPRARFLTGWVIFLRRSDVSFGDVMCFNVHFSLTPALSLWERGQRMVVYVE